MEISDINFGFNKSPAFQFYVQDFLSGVKFFSAEETGAYILLLCEQWDSGFIENNDKILKKITGISPKKLQKVVEKFQIIDNKLINKRLAEEKAKKIAFIGRASEGGKESARLRAEEKSRSVENKQVLKSKSSSSTSTSTSTSEEKTTTTEFAENEKFSAEQNPVEDSFSSEQKTASTEIVNAKPKKEKPPTPEKSFSVYAECVSHYEKYIKFLGGELFFDKVSGAAMKQIIAKLGTATIDKGEGQDQEISNTFLAILRANKRWQPFHQTQTKLTQINSNLQEIIIAIKNPTQNGKPISAFARSQENPFTNNPNYGSGL
jgi:uncharacterized protein YdaU (DUF1376 family)